MLKRIPMLVAALIVSTAPVSAAADYPLDHPGPRAGTSGPVEIRDRNSLQTTNAALEQPRQATGEPLRLSTLAGSDPGAWIAPAERKRRHSKLNPRPN